MKSLRSLKVTTMLYTVRVGSAEWCKVSILVMSQTHLYKVVCVYL